VMLNGGDDEVAAFLQVGQGSALDGQVVGFGPGGVR
jgi:hypothetical protein